MIKPSVGRVVWYRPEHVDPEEQPFAAIVTYVWNDRLVNLAVFDHYGVIQTRTSALLVQEGDPKPEVGSYAEWMPYQIGQAKKHEAETQIARPTGH
jgi:hypothetical protein